MVGVAVGVAGAVAVAEGTALAAMVSLRKGTDSAASYWE